ncbi:hypothetical protein GCM10009839_48760 [Catenulispora yoronensis]|uniref:Uncharacterized protein n=1 Tax=Catenulispora yoronensis TaxID=450799 RepID=A0ABN2UP21_9ACTN
MRAPIVEGGLYGWRAVCAGGSGRVTNWIVTRYHARPTAPRPSLYETVSFRTRTVLLYETVSYTTLKGLRHGSRAEA